MEGKSSGGFYTVHKLHLLQESRVESRSQDTLLCSYPAPDSCFPGDSDLDLTQHAWFLSLCFQQQLSGKQLKEIRMTVIQ